MTIDVFATLPRTRREVLAVLKRLGAATIVEVAQQLGMTHEGVRAHVIQLQEEGWIKAECDTVLESAEQGAGRPAIRYCLSVAGDHVFPKFYDDLTVLLLDAVMETVDEEALREVLAKVTDIRVEALGGHAADSLEKKLEALASLYLENDPFMEIRRDGDDFVLVERNCPFLNVALQRPAICSTTVSTIRRMLGYEVVRDHRFQDGEARCEFRVIAGRPVRRPRRFTFEPPKDEKSR